METETKITLDGIEYPIAYCKQERNQWVVQKCPYCGKKHYHGKGEGHRVSHCLRNGYNPGYILKLQE